MRVDFHCEVLLVIVEAVLLRYTEDLPQVLVNDELDADSLVLVVHQVLLQPALNQQESPYYHQKGPVESHRALVELFIDSSDQIDKDLLGETANIETDVGDSPDLHQVITVTNPEICQPISHLTRTAAEVFFKECSYYFQLILRRAGKFI